MKKVMGVNYDFDGLNVGEIYDVINESNDHYLIKSVRGHNSWYLKTNFEVVKDSKVVIYIDDDCGYLTKGKNYNVEYFDDALYRVIDNDGRERLISKERFLEPNTMPRPSDDTKQVQYIGTSDDQLKNGKIYEVEEFDHGRYLVKADNGRVYNVSKAVFTDSKQVGGTHYTDMNVQPFDFIEANKLTFFEGNVVKYLSRYKSKDGNRDIDKAIHYVKESFNRLGDFQSRDIKMTAEEYCKANNLPPVVELALCWILEYPVSVSLELIVKLLEELKS